MVYWLMSLNTYENFASGVNTPAASPAGRTPAEGLNKNCSIFTSQTGDTRKKTVFWLCLNANFVVLINAGRFPALTPSHVVVCVYKRFPPRGRLYCRPLFISPLN